MASSKPANGAPRQRRLPRRLLVWSLVIVLAVAAWFQDAILGYARTGASYGARVACSCHYIGGRDLSDCRKDFEPGMGLVVLSADPEAKSVTARFPLLSTQTARMHQGEGCRLDSWEN
jgi:hypothetical protein